MYHMAQYEELPDPRTMVRLEEALLRKIASRGGEKLQSVDSEYRRTQSEAERSESDAMYPPPRRCARAATRRATAEIPAASPGRARSSPRAR